MVGREPLDGGQLVGGEPAGGEVFVEGERGGGEVAEVAVHGEVEVGVGVLYRGELPEDLDVGVEFFFEFAGEGLMVRFAVFDFASGKFPPAFPGAVAALGGKDGGPLLAHSGHYLDLGQGLRRGRG